jgi:hypothetical protein
VSAPINGADANLGDVMLRQFYRLAMLGLLVATPAPSFADDLPVVVYPRMHNYPGQQLCQVDRNDRRYRELCTPHSYRPYGALGYRPYGTYRPYRSARRIWVAPNARVVHINRQD